MILMSFLKKYVFQLILGTGLLLAVLSCYLYYNWSQKEIKNLRYNNVVLEHSIETQKITIDNLIKDIEAYKEITNNLRKKNLEYQEDLRELEKKFTKNNRDLGKIAKEKPNLVEDIINDATKKELDCLQAITRNEPCE